MKCWISKFIVNKEVAVVLLGKIDAVLYNGHATRYKLNAKALQLLLMLHDLFIHTMLLETMSPQ